jgi:type II secretory ATPase GspE/PulE/Tfp pilus assembly ATPase PilB-like protein
VADALAGAGSGNSPAVEALLRAAAAGSPRERCEASGFAWLEKPAPCEPAAVRLIPADAAVRLRVVPLGVESGRLRLAMADPFDLNAVDEAGAIGRLPVLRVGVAAEAFGELMRQAYGVTAARMAESLASDGDLADTASENNLDAIEADDVHRMAEQPTLVNLVNLLILEAIQKRTSDIHIEPFEGMLKVKYRVDGVLVEQPSPPKHLQPAIVGRIKIMSHMNIAERYVPQDGHISLRFEGRKVDIRVSTVPTIYGESVVMRILDKSNLPLDLRSLGMNDRLVAMMDKLIAKPHGLVLVTGPTGSGKTTTLYAALSKLYDPRKKIITIEDPVEYELTGINQIPVNPKRGLTFAGGLRSILRQDPDVILVGEIRDAETVDIAIRSALTGHLILSTLHTNDALSSVGRLVDMGAESFLVASVLEGLLAQRLGRRICRKCARKVPMSDDQRVRIAPAEVERFGGQVTVGAGCEACSGSGFRGRLGFFELARINPHLRSAIAEGQSAMELRQLVDADFLTMREDGMDKALGGETTIEEVLRATQDVDEG